jgi:hypothetical protein
VVMVIVSNGNRAGHWWSTFLCRTVLVMVLDSHGHGVGQSRSWCWTVTVFV